MNNRHRLFGLMLIGPWWLMGCAKDNGDPSTMTAVPEEAVVQVQGGAVQGYQEEGIRIFKGIPYASPPTGENRWREPQPVVSWQGTLDASEFAPDCMQLPFPSDAAPLGETPAEDCLYVNVWAPEASAEPAPVLIWIYGGGYVNGGASPKVYDGSEFARQGVIFVSFNYRLGRFGFFAHPALSAESDGHLGNYAFMDQIAAVQWVKDNISAFNGDPGQVTIMGESAGGGSVHNLMQTPDARGLFHHAIIMSGGGRSLMGERPLSKTDGTTPSAEQIGVNFANAHGIEGSGAEALAALRALPAEDIVDGLNLTALFMPPQVEPTYVGGPIADGYIVQGSTQSLLEAGKVARVPVMVGTTSQDLGFSAAADKSALFSSFGPYAEAARETYDPQQTRPLPMLNFMVGQDRAMQEPARYFASKMTQLGQPAYLYRFSYVAEAIRDGQGAQHASEIPFFFQTIDDKYEVLSEQDKLASSLPFRYVVSFVKNGNPNLDSLPQWDAFDPDKANIMDFTMDAEAVEGTDPWKARMDVVEKAATFSADTASD